MGNTIYLKEIYEIIKNTNHLNKLEKVNNE